MKSKHFYIALIFALSTLWGFVTVSHAQVSNRIEGAVNGPKYSVDPYWPKPLPNNWILGQVSGVAVDAKDNV